MTLTLFGCCWTCSLIFLMILCVYDPRSIIFLGALIPEKYYTYFPWGILVTIFHFYMMIVLALNTIVAVGFGLVYAVYLTEMLTKELRMGQKYYRTLDSLRKPANVIKVYRSFQILHCNGYFLGIFVLLGHGLCVIAPILCNFILIEYWNQLQPLSKVPMLLCIPSTMGFWAMVLHQGKLLFVRGNKILWSWRSHNWGRRRDNKIMERFRWSCWPIVLRHGNQIVLARITQFNYFKGIIRGILRALLTVK